VKLGATGLIPAAENDRVAGEPAMNGTIKIKRAYDPVSKDDGYRILVGRLWPRGVSKQRAALDLWLRDIAPSTELREWFRHDPLKWDEFRKRYWHELEDKQKDVNVIKQKLRLGPVTLIYSARDREHNAAVALKEYLERSEKAAIAIVH
jgi:uncharacterized protein YeaO (DUF488 family)